MCKCHFVQYFYYFCFLEKKLEVILTFSFSGVMWFLSKIAVTFSADMELELGELLQEFQDVVEELKAPSQSRPHAYQHVLREAKGRTRLGDDSGVEDSDYSE